MFKMATWTIIDKADTQIVAVKYTAEKKSYIYIHLYMCVMSAETTMMIIRD